MEVGNILLTKINLKVNKFRQMDSSDNEIDIKPYKRRKLEKEKRKEKEVLGIFGDSDTEEETFLKKGLRFSAIGFAKSNKQEEEKEEEEEVEQYVEQKVEGNDDEYSDDEEVFRPSFGASMKMNFTTGYTEDKPLNFMPKLFSKPEVVETPKTFMTPRELKPDTNSKTDRHSSAYGLGAKMLAKMGYVNGKGLGKDGEGIIKPIETQLRPSKLGLGGISEKPNSQTSRNKIEKKLQGKEKEEEKEKKNKYERRQTRPKDVYKTISELQSEGLEIPNVFKNIVDMTGKGRTSLSEFNPSETNEEMNRNIKEQQILQRTEHDLLIYKNEWDSIKSQKKYLEYEESELIKSSEKLFVDTENLESIISIAEDLQKITIDKSLSSETILQQLSISLNKINIHDIGKYGEDFQDIIVSSLSSILTQLLNDWDPFEDPRYLKIEINEWKNLFENLLLKDERVDSVLEEYSIYPNEKNKKLTLFESMLSITWLKILKDILINHWNPLEPHSAIIILEEWNDIVPNCFIENLLQTVIIPKIKKLIADWNPKTKTELDYKNSLNPANWLFPWIPYIDSNIFSSLKTELKLKFIMLLKSSKDIIIDEYITSNLLHWKSFFGEQELTDILLQNALSQILSNLIENFEINPQNQNPEPLQSLIKNWKPFFGSDILSSIISQSFFPKFLNVLYQWIINKESDYVDIKLWFDEWWNWFDCDLRNNNKLIDGFREGLDMINQAIDLGYDKIYRLKKSRKYKLESGIDLSLIKNNHEKLKAKFAKLTESKSTKPEPSLSDQVKGIPSSHLHITLRDVVEDYCQKHDLFLVPMKTHVLSFSHPLYRVSSNPTGKGGTMCYFDDDVVWVEVDGGKRYVPIPIEELENRVKR